MTASQQEEVTDRIMTIPNVISFFRLCLVPVFFALLMKGHNGWATFVFAFAAATDFVDGQIARRTHCVSKLGQILDPAVDVCLMVFGVVGLLIVHRLPIWIAVFIAARELYLLLAGSRLLRVYHKRVPVIYPGKFATTFLFVGFAGMLLDTPKLNGLDVVSVSWLPGFNALPCSWGIWFVYAGLVLAAGVTVYYIKTGYKLKAEALAERRVEQQVDGTKTETERSKQ